MRRTFAPSVQVVAGLALAAPSALLGPAALAQVPSPACGAPAQSSVTCRGDLPLDVVYDPAADLTITLAPDARVAGGVQLGGLTIVAGRSREWSGQGALAIEAQAGSSVGGQQGLFIRSGGSARVNAQGAIRSAAHGINAWADGDVRVGFTGLAEAGQLGVFARSFSGDVEVANAGDIVVTEAEAAGVRADSQRLTGGVVRVTNSGRITAQGGFSAGVSATLGRDGGGRVEVINSGVIFASLRGIYADGPVRGLVSVENTGRIDARDAEGQAILATATFGDVQVVNRGQAVAHGDDGQAILALGDIFNPEQLFPQALSIANTGRAHTLGRRAAGLAVDGQFGTIAVENAGEISTLGESAHAIQVDSRRAQVAVSTSGRITTQGAGAHGLQLTNAEGAARVALGGTIDAAGWAAVASARDAEVTVVAGAEVSGGAGGVWLEAAERARLEVRGRLRSDGVAVMSDGAPLELVIAGTGRLEGGLRLGAGADSVENSGAMTLGHSDFGGGADRLLNRGLLKASSGQVTIQGLERLENTGSIDLVDGAATGRLRFEGTRLSGAGGARLVLEVGRDASGAMTADRVVAGAFSGSTQVAFRPLQGGPTLGSSAIFAMAGEPIGPAAFTVDPASNAGLIGYAVTPSGAEARVTAGPGAGALAAARLNTAAATAWRQTSETIGARLAEPHGRAPDEGLRMWAAASASEGKTGRQHFRADVGGAEFQATGRTRESAEALAGGLEAVRGPWRLGLDVNHRRATGKFEGGLVRTRLTTSGLGAHVAWRDGGTHAGVQVRALATSAGVRGAGEVRELQADGWIWGFSAQAGRYLGGPRGYLHPQLTLGWATADLGTLSAADAQLAFAENAWMTGSAGVRAGRRWNRASGDALDLSLGVFATRESGAEGRLALRAGGSAATLRDPAPDTLLRTDLRIDYLSGGPIGARLSVAREVASDQGGNAVTAQLGMSLRW